MTRHLPNFLTCCNLLCGCLAIVYVLEGGGIPAAYLVWLACVFDFFDGFAARMLKVASPIGKELDSLADIVSFGIVPALVMYKLIGASTESALLPLVAFSIAVFSALRLAIFNVDDTQRDSFRGLNTPANTLFITSLPLLKDDVGRWLFQPWILILITVIFSLLLVSRIEIFALKFKNFTWRDNRTRFTFLILSVLLLVALRIGAIPIIILLYILLSLVDNTITARRSAAKL
jgi:CDP-diacylglycerol--serine O-phosphatidyltransferase